MTSKERERAIKDKHADERAMEKYLKKYKDPMDIFMKTIQWKYGTKYFKYIMNGEVVYSTEKRNDLKELKYE